MSSPSAVILVIVDGLSGVSSNTAMQSAMLPTLDAASARGRVGLIDPVRPGLACGSDTAHLAIFGYNPVNCYRGRGAFEAMGGGISLQPGDVAFKCNFASMDEDTGIVTARCADRNPKMHVLGARLAKRLNGIIIPSFKDIKVAVKHTGNHRCVMKLSGDLLSDEASNTDPLIDNRPLLKSAPSDPHSTKAVKTANVINAVSAIIHDTLKHDNENYLTKERIPATNILLLRGASERIQISPFHEVHGLHSFLIAPTEIIAGVGITAGIEIVKAEGATGNYNTDLLSKAKACVTHLMLPNESRTSGYQYEMGIIHVKAVDEAGHDQDSQKKEHWLEQVDAMTAEIFRQLVASDRRDVVIIVTGDHTTPTVYGDHTCEPVPILVADVFDPDIPHPRDPIFISSDKCSSFGEIAAGMSGSLGRFPALEIVPMIKRILSIADKTV